MHSILEYLCSILEYLKVYQMSDPVRGRVMIINNNKFYEGETLVDTRNGSEVDCANLATLFRQMRFDMVKTSKELSDLTAEVCKRNCSAVITN